MDGGTRNAPDRRRGGGAECSSCRQFEHSENVTAPPQNAHHMQAQEFFFHVKFLFEVGIAPYPLSAPTT